MFRVLARDDRNQHVRLVRWMPVSPAVALRSRSTRSLLLVVVVATLIVAAFWAIGPDVAGLSIFSIIIAPTMAVVLTALATLRTAWRDRAWTLRQSMGRLARCAACGYDLSASEPEPDGCTVCPECAAAWRLADHTPQTVIVPSENLPLQTPLSTPHTHFATHKPK